jgi:hypothetical protein
MTDACQERGTQPKAQNDGDMTLQLAPEEPEAGPWRVEPLAVLVQAITQGGQVRDVPGRPLILAIDGRSNNGKTTLAGRIAAAVAGAIVIHTDDIAWRHSRFGWADLLVDGILVPLHERRDVRYRPPRWAEYERPGSIDVPAECPLLIIEGDGAGRREVAHLIDVLIWVQSDEREAGQRLLGRIGMPDEVPTMLAHREWMAEEIPFNTAERTWERAGITVCGTPRIPCDPLTEVVVAFAARP